MFKMYHAYACKQNGNVLVLQMSESEIDLCSRSSGREAEPESEPAAAYIEKGRIKVVAQTVPFRQKKKLCNTWMAAHQEVVHLQ